MGAGLQQGFFDCFPNVLIFHPLDGGKKKKKNLSDFQGWLFGFFLLKSHRDGKEKTKQQNYSIISSRMVITFQSIEIMKNLFGSKYTSMGKTLCAC